MRARKCHRCDAMIANLTEEELRRFVLDCALMGELRASAYDTRKPEKLLETAKRLRINTDEIRKSLKAEQAAKKELRGKGTDKTPEPLKRTKVTQRSAA